MYVFLTNKDHKFQIHHLHLVLAKDCVSLLSSSLVRMIVVVSALRKEQMKSEEIVSLENTLGDSGNVEKELYKIRNNIQRGGI